MAGTGKSTIAKSICEKLEEKKMLAGALFCSRQVEACRDHAKIIPTIASQLAYYSCTFADNLGIELESDPQLATKTIKKQMGLLVKPWKSAVQGRGLSSITPAIVIDALDECAIRKNLLDLGELEGSLSNKVSKAYAQGAYSA